MTKYVTSLTLILIVLLSGCVQVIPVEADKSTQLAVSSATDMQVNYANGAAFFLAPQYLEEVSLNETQQNNVYTTYGNAIVNNLIENGYAETLNASSAEFTVGYGIALSKDLSDAKINTIFGVSPGLPSAADLDKGSFLIYIKDTAMQQIVWRGNVQGFAQDNLSHQEREIKTQSVVDSVLKQFHKEK